MRPSGIFRTGRDYAYCVKRPKLERWVKIMDKALSKKEARVRSQFRESMADTAGHMVTCGCGHQVPLRFMHRCYYCREYFCETCGGVHFGMTREEYRKQNPVIERRGE